jgi:hypothetical protein
MDRRPSGSGEVRRPLIRAGLHRLSLSAGREGGTRHSMDAATEPEEGETGAADRRLPSKLTMTAPTRTARFTTSASIAAPFTALHLIVSGVLNYRVTSRRTMRRIHARRKNLAGPRTRVCSNWPDPTPHPEWALVEGPEKLREPQLRESSRPRRFIIYFSEWIGVEKDHSLSSKSLVQFTGGGRSSAATAL